MWNLNDAQGHINGQFVSSLYKAWIHLSNKLYPSSGKGRIVGGRRCRTQLLLITLQVLPHSTLFCLQLSVNKDKNLLWGVWQSEHMLLYKLTVKPVYSYWTISMQNHCQEPCKVKFSSQEPGNGMYPQPYKSAPHLPTLFL